MKNKKAIFASGCFWGTQYYFSKAEGVIKTIVGYTGGKEEEPTYGQVSAHKTHHVEAIEVVYDNQKTSYEKLAKLFFETHDPTQKSGQGPDIGPQYKSVIFYSNNAEKKIAENFISQLRHMDLDVATEVREIDKFWPAESYHQNYYQKSGGSPYCHRYQKLFYD